MTRELAFRQELDTLTPEAREEKIAEHKDMLALLKKIADNAPLHRQQLEEIWRDQDGLADMAFNPKVFFRMHDSTGDGFIDAKELEALFYVEAKRIHTG